MEWFRWYHGAISDPKWPLIARKSGQNIGTVVSIWAALLEFASQSEARGSVAGFDCETIDALYGYPDGTTETVCNAMKRHGLLSETHVIVSWSKRQVKREREDNSSERVRRYRENKKAKDSGSKEDSNANVTPLQRHETPRTEQIRTDKKEESLPEKPETGSHGDEYSLPCEDGSEYTYPEKYLATARKAYPLVDIPLQIVRARAWLEANPTKKKTRRGMTKFLNSWLDDKQQRAEASRAKDAPPQTTGSEITAEQMLPAKWLRAVKS